MSYFDDPPEGEEENFKDVPDEVEGKEAPAADVKVIRNRPAPAAPVVEEEVEEEIEEVEEEDDSSSILTDARLRLEQGKLYELVMKHDIFEGVEADPKAVKNVQKEIRAYAQERMEIMLGMRQEKVETPAGFPMEMFPFNSMEVEVLKALAATATKGESRDAEPLELGPQKPPARTTLNPIGKNSGKTTAVVPKPVLKKAAPKPLAKSVNPVKRAKANAEIQRILEEEGLTMEEINEVFDPNREPLDRKKLAKMTEEEVIERNRQASNRNKRAENPNAIPMPTAEQLEQVYMQRAQTTEAQKPEWRKLIDMVKVMPPTAVNNTGNNE